MRIALRWVTAVLLMWGVAGTGSATAGVRSTVKGCTPWKEVSFPPLAAGITTGISGTSATDVWAVGSFDYAPSEPIIRHWDGTAWRSVPQERVDGSLLGVAALSPTDAWAVGWDGPVLTMHWDGTGWSRVSAPSPGTYERLNAVTAISTDNVWAVGETTGSDGAIHGLTEHWDGRKWRVVRAPDASSYTTLFYAASASGPDDVWAVGYVQPGPELEYQPLVEHWDGTEWTVVETPPPPYGSHNALYGVTAISPTDAWAVGDYGIVGTDIYPLLEHWDGTAWSLVDVDVGSGTLFGVSAIASGDVWAVGISTGNTGNRPLSLYWDGTAWTEVPTPHPGGNGGLVGVDGISHDDIWAAGSYFDPDLNNGTPLSERSKGPCPR
jgi:hypothetical protein